ncbi:MAG: DNA-processing protein DprA [Phycisphaeraceae bacterium]
MDHAERDAMLRLLLTPGMGAVRIGRCVAAFGSATATLGASTDRLAEAMRCGGQQAGKLRSAMHDAQREADSAREREAAAAADVQIIALGETGYPRLLEHIPDAPPLLWVRGELREDDALALAMVGSRRCTLYGREQAERFAYQCAHAGLCIVSGGAYGIDAAAHRGALKAGGRTIAVLGSGLENPYPREHHELYDEIAQRGAVVSEFPMVTPPAAENFPRRNRIISGLALGVLVVEAANRSGAHITARLCVEEHGRELMAIPGRVDAPTSAGCHKMIREGWAKLVTNAADVLDGLGEAGQMLKVGMGVDDGHGEGGGGDGGGGGGGGLFEVALTDSQQRVVAALDEPRSLDELAAATGAAVQQIQSDLTMLELRGTVRRRGGLFVRRGKSDS